MSWECPHQSGSDDFCDRRKEACKPLSPGCVLHGKAQFVAADQEGKAKEPTPENAEAKKSEGAFRV